MSPNYSVTATLLQLLQLLQLWMMLLPSWRGRDEAGSDLRGMFKLMPNPRAHKTPFSYDQSPKLETESEDGNSLLERGALVHHTREAKQVSREMAKKKIQVKLAKDCNG